MIPQYFERDLLHGRPSPVALYADASYFLIYQRVAGAVAAVAHTVGAEIETARLIAIGVDPAIAVVAPDPMPLTAVPVFNPEGGYATYVLPAAFVLILQQMLLMGVGLLGTLPGADSAGGDTHRRRLRPVTILAGKLLAYLALEAVILPIYLIVLPYLYGLPRLGGIVPILIFAVPFVLSVAGLGFVVAGILRKPIRVALILAALGLPLFMVAGFSWPSEAIPPFIRLISFLVPSTSGIDGFVKLSQLGAPLAAAKPELFTLCALAIFYNLIALAREAHHEILVLTDGDVRVGPNYLREVIAPFADAGRCRKLGREIDHQRHAGRQFVDESRRILAEHRNIGDLLDRLDGRSRIHCETMWVRERSFGSEDVDHWHWTLREVDAPVVCGAVGVATKLVELVALALFTLSGRQSFVVRSMKKVATS